jgi:2-oxoglutarate ferredoxin oxidoreductase subunit beta
MAPTTLPDQVTTSSPTGRDVKAAGYPIRMAELIGGLPGAVYVTRQAVFDVRGIRRTKRAIKTAFRAQLEGLGFAMVEVLSTCNTNWGMSPQEALDWAKEHMVAYFPLGDTKVSEDVRAFMED